MGFLSSTLKVTVKGFIAWTAIDFTVQEGFWFSSSDSIAAFNTFSSKIKKFIPENLNQILKIPNLHAKEYLRNTWNTQVTNAAEFSLAAPKQISQFIEKNMFENKEVNTNVK